MSHPLFNYSTHYSLKTAHHRYLETSHYTALILSSTLSLPRAINIKFPQQPHQKYNITQHGELGFSKLRPGSNVEFNSHEFNSLRTLYPCGDDG